MRLIPAAAAVTMAALMAPYYGACVGSLFVHDIPHAVVSSLIPSAEAGDRIKHRDIPWYESHPRERAEMIRLCRRDTLIARSSDCANAELGSVGARAKAGLGWNKPSDGIIPLEEYVRLHGG